MVAVLRCGVYDFVLHKFFLRIDNGQIRYSIVTSKISRWYFYHQVNNTSIKKTF